ncbi:hypothetical protein [Schumannella sp. 10F1B-5-1]|nr:hypothetical protein [Schumannella sp. 10F1B-5-1]
MNGFLKFCAVVGTGILMVIGAAVTVSALVLAGVSIASIASGGTLFN